MALLKDYVKYDPDSVSGLVWIQDKARAKSGDMVGSKNSTGHWQFKFEGRHLLTSRVIMHLERGFDLSSDKTIDHKDRNKDNNTIDNYRIVDKGVNCRNRSVSRNNKVGLNGVLLRRSRFVAYINKGGKQIQLGTGTLFEAACLRKSAELLHYDLLEVL